MLAAPPQIATHCLILACGNSLRADDGVGPWLAEWAAQRFRYEGKVRIIARQQWTPDLAAAIAQSRAVIFVDCSAIAAAGSVEVRHVAPAQSIDGLATHQMRASELLTLARDFYDSLPLSALLVTVGAASLEFGEDFSGEVTASLPHTCSMLEEMIEQFLS